MDHDGNEEVKGKADSTTGIRSRFYQPPKNPITIPIDDEVILFFKKKAYEEKVGYHTLMNRVLRDYIMQDIREEY